MRVVLVAGLVALAVYTSGQQPCDSHHACNEHGLAHCPGHTVADSHVVCHEGTCECTGGATNQTCAQASDCMCPDHHLDHHPDQPPPPPPDHPGFHDDHDHAHCVDGICHCAEGHADH